MANPDFSTVGGQLAYWLTHIGQFFKGGWSGSGENGVDIKMPVGTPVYALASGPVVGQGYYGGGGVVSVEQNKGRVWYYQHLDLIEPSIEKGNTKQVQAGQLLGWSGGQSTGGHHPSSLKFSDDGTGHGWPHIEVGVNAPWGGIWGPMSEKGPNVDPLPILKSIAQSGGSATTGTPTEQTAFTTPGIPGPQDFVNAIGTWLKSTFGVLFTWLTDPLRILKLVAGGVLIFTASQIAIAGIGRELAGPAVEAAATMAAPAAGAAYGAARGARATVTPTGRHATVTPAPAPASVQEPQARVRPDWLPTFNAADAQTFLRQNRPRPADSTPLNVVDAEPAQAAAPATAQESHTEAHPVTRLNPDFTTPGRIRGENITVRLPTTEGRPYNPPRAYPESDINQEEQGRQEGAMRWFSQKGPALDAVLEDLRTKQPTSTTQQAAPNTQGLGGVRTTAPATPRPIPTQEEILQSRKARERAAAAGIPVADWTEQGAPGASHMARPGTSLVTPEYEPTGGIEKVLYDRLKNGRMTLEEYQEDILQIRKRQRKAKGGS